MRRLACWGFWALVLALPAVAQDVPPALRDWQSWVLHDAPWHACPFVTGTAPDEDSYRCAWPGRLDFSADASGGRFSLGVHVDAPDWVILPGDGNHWPVNVVDHAQAVAVLDHDGGPAVYLQPGEHLLRGDLPWTTLPPRIAVPDGIGLVALSVDGKPVARVERHDGQLTLGEAAATERVADALSVHVYRRLGDGLPATLATRMQIDVTGSARELLLGPALPAGFTAIALHSGLPARLEPDGRLRVQLRAGQWQLELQARATAPLADVAFKLPASPWPRQEVWSYAGDEAFRHSRVEGRAIDAAQAGVPPDWRSLAAFVVDDGNGLKINGGARGLESDRGDSLTLARRLWLDFDGDGVTANDHLTGKLRQARRLDVSAPWQLQRAAQQDVPLPISGDHGGSGVEIREREVDLDAGLRLPSRHGALPASGWELPLDGIDATLSLPSGYRLLGAPGADRSPDSWVARWSLLDLFVVALIALLAGRLLGWPMALLAAGFLALSQHEAGAPRWTLLLVLALMLFGRALPLGRLRAVVRYGAGAALALAVLWSLPFAADQMRAALHPQLENESSMSVATQFEPLQAGQQRVPKVVRVVEKIAAPPAPPAPPPAVVEEQSAMAVSAPAADAAPRLDQAGSSLAAQGPIQAGPGTPDWDVGNDYRLGWSGPVGATQTVRLVIAPAWLVRLLRVAMLALLAALLARLVLALWPAATNDGGHRWRIGGAVGLLALALLPAASRAQDMPTPELLKQLRERLTEAPKCAPDCAAIAQATLDVTGDRLQLVLIAHAGAGVALPLPDGGGDLPLADVAVDGHADAPLTRDGDNLLLRLDHGIHGVTLDYRISADNLRLHFPLPSRRVQASAPGWSVDGIDDGHLSGDGIGLHRQSNDAAGAAKAALSQAFPPYVRFTRQIRFGVDWTVHNAVERIAPRDDGFSVSLPLLPGEHPLGDALRVHDGMIDVPFSSGQYAVTWNSRLDRRSALDLVAPPLAERAEVWLLDADMQWHLDASGVPLSESASGMRFQPLPGEKLHVVPSQPLVLAGDSLAFDAVDAEGAAGERATETTLKLTARSTRGGEHAIALPTGAELLDARRDGEALSLSVRDGKLGLPLLPGTHAYELRLREPRGVGAVTRTAAVSLAAPAANLRVGLTLPQDRWVLWAFGPADGPAVLYWAQLAVLLVAAWLLGRYAPTPLRFHHWLLLGLGFSAFAWGAYALVAAWLIALGLRARHPPSPALERNLFNLLQIGLAALTVVALLALIGAVPQGLLGLPEMHVAGNGSTAWNLHWFADRSGDALPQGGAVSLPLWAYKLAMLAWALWLANALIGWLRWAFDAWSAGGYWRRAGSDVPAPIVPPADHD
jgi:hypothetical protein